MKLKVIKNVFFILIVLSMAGKAMVASAASVGTGGISGAFSKNSFNVSVVAGSGSSFNNNYVILGVGLGYYVMQGLELGIDVQHWFSGDPSITKTSPQIRYVFTQLKVTKPYVGAFYRRTFIENEEDSDSFGYRAGAYFSSTNGVYIGGGIVYEEYKNCNFVECSTSYPEILMSVSF
ncbi:MAG: hypothetical protein KAT61_02805 [Gammaproteobacteria bacterium]|nr:hypothetical protein [Gammaproteobacteria bacterium]